MQDFLNCVQYEDLDENDQDIADCIGLENFKNLVRTFGGSKINIKVPKNIALDYRNKQICSEFNGGNYKQLARKYNLSEASVYRIIRDHYKSKSKVSK
ncbi:MAG: DNA-binding protein [Oscillospiraceae bacterium]|nr:DNA-binding protein [Oscillospiraceae bacterium]